MSQVSQPSEPDRKDGALGGVAPPSFGAASPRWEEEAADPLVVWVRWHVVELAGVAVPLGLAVAASWWFVLLAAGVAGAWAAQETRQAHRRGRLGAAATTAIDARRQETKS
ncbi:conjugal transfer protein TraH [Actinomadura sp. KC216]|uniref:conjugal transfer protein TraH n=1 Tax=Actinomadura sp. KC216 TaxID=2530370 RepID=UPI00104D9FFA|nr:conjugal transfer protein TraH [Actinomadura sp. KC216]TDB84487.1 conjugal transfer protein TraH [Actinomadura sp. KC216]